MHPASAQLRLQEKNMLTAPGPSLPATGVRRPLTLILNHDEMHPPGPKQVRACNQGPVPAMPMPSQQ